MRTISRIVGFFSALLLLGATNLNAQISIPGSGSSGGEEQVEAEQVIDTANRSFRAHVESELNQALRRNPDMDTEALTSAAERLQAEFLETANEEILALKGDGILRASEASDELEGLRDSFSTDLDAAISAIRDGFEPPPLARDYGPSDDFAMVMARYTFMERNPPLHWLWMLLAIAGGLFLAWLLNRWLGKSASALSSYRYVRPSQLIEALKGPLYLAAIVLGLYFGLQWIWVPGLASGYVDTSLNVLLAITGFWFLWNASDLIGHLLARLFQRTYGVDVDRHVEMIIIRVLKIVVVVIAALVLVKVILDTGFTGMLAGLGVIGLALYLILKGALENLVASFTIFGDKPVRVGDLMIYDGKLGTVENIGFRSTCFRILDGDVLTIPNANLVDDTIHNVSARPSIRRRFRIGLPYDTPAAKIDEAMEILSDILGDYEGRPDDMDERIVFDAFGAYDLQLMIEYFFEPADYWSAKDNDTRINQAIFQRFNEAGIGFAFPTQTTLLSTREQPPELFLNPGDEGPIDIQVLDRAAEPSSEEPDDRRQRSSSRSDDPDRRQASPEKPASSSGQKGHAEAGQSGKDAADGSGSDDGSGSAAGSGE